MVRPPPLNFRIFRGLPPTFPHFYTPYAHTLDAITQKKGGISPPPKILRLKNYLLPPNIYSHRTVSPPFFFINFGCYENCRKCVVLPHFLYLIFRAFRASPAVKIRGGNPPQIFHLPG